MRREGRLPPVRPQRQRALPQRQWALAELELRLFRFLVV